MDDALDAYPMYCCVCKRKNPYDHVFVICGEGSDDVVLSDSDHSETICCEECWHDIDGYNKQLKKTIEELL